MPILPRKRPARSRASDWLSPLWHGVALGLAGRLRHPGAIVRLQDHKRAVELHYHMLGGGVSRQVVSDSGVGGRLAPSTHGGVDLMAWLDSEQIHLPQSVNRYASASLNRELYFWLGAYLACQQPCSAAAGLPAGLRHLLLGLVTCQRAIAQFPALEARYQRLCMAELEQRQTALPKLGPGLARVHQLEAAIRFCLGSGQPPVDAWLCEAITQARNGIVIDAPADWCRLPTPFLPVPLWGRAGTATSGFRLRWLKRKVRRRARGRQKPLRTPRFDASRQPQQSAGDAATGDYLYREWDCNQRAYRNNWCRVSEQPPKTRSDWPVALPDVGSEPLSRQVRRQFEALRQQPGWARHLESGEELDVDAFVDAVADRRARGSGGSRLYRSRARQSRDLSVAVLLDASRSTRSWVGEHQVMEIARRSVTVLGDALVGVGDDFALYAFSSDSRLRVRCDRIKAFDERFAELSRQRLQSLTPANYTRMGAAVRHVGARLRQRPSKRKLLLVLTDGKPNDPTDRYEGEYAVEDTRRSLRELRSGGVDCFGLTIDRHGRDYLPHMFGPGHYAVFSDPSSLPRLLPRMFARITSLTC